METSRELAKITNEFNLLRKNHSGMETYFYTYLSIVKLGVA